MTNEKLVPPCSYQGGKQRLASQIHSVISERHTLGDNTNFYDLCCGSGSVSLEMINNGLNPLSITMVDASPWGNFYESIGDDTFSTEAFKLYISEIPKDITRIKTYAEEMLKRPANDGMFDNMIYKFLILQACSFGSTATWVEDNQWKKAGGLRNYWLPTPTSNRKSPVNPMMPMPTSLYRRVESLVSNLDGINGIHGFVEDVSVPKGSIVYLDPPYKNVHSYGYELDYMNYVDNLVNTVENVTVYVSEGFAIDSADEQLLLSSGRTKGNISGKAKKKPVEEWLNVFKSKV